MIRGIILEGLSCSGKTSLLYSLKKVHAENPENERSVLVLGEHYSQVLQNINGEYKKYERKEHLEILNDRVEMLESLNNFSSSLGPSSRKARGVFFIYERFHLNHRQAFLINDLNMIEKIEQRIIKLNVVCYLLAVSNSKIKDRLIARDKNLNSLAECDMQLKIDEYIRNRDELNFLAESSQIESKAINTDTLNWDAYANEIIAEMDKQY